MSKEELENNKSALELLLSENSDKCTDYKAQLAKIDQELSDLGKPEVASEFLDKINETIVEAVENIELDDGVSCDFELDYDNRVTISDIRFDDTHGIAEKIYEEVVQLFAEVSSDILEAQKADEACN